jgi:hypothetical protein
MQVAGALYAYDASEGTGEVPVFTLEGDQEFAKVGAAFASGNFSGGSTRLMALAAPTRSGGGRVQNGAVYVVNPEGLSGELPLGEAAGEPVFADSQDFSRLGWRLSAGDENGDGVADLLVTQPWLDTVVPGLMTGAALLWKGGPGFPVGSGTAVPASWTLFGPSKQARFGDAALIADVNGDGYGDLVVAASRDSGQARHGGSVSVYLGSADPGGCFLATAVFGPEGEGKLRVLRAFRDRRLLSSSPGRAFVQGYYRHGPAAADFVRGQPYLQVCLRILLLPLVGLASLCT